ncbi:MAG: ABC transporter permease [Acidobacteria bacterium]|nr:ABC transporter permease [Acidobacteriota bacterium]MCZ6746455.1 ABC transporter permease [Acidobacteriota bacterium]
MRYELFIALRYLRARRKQAFVSVITFISILGVAVGVAALIIAQAVETGFFEELQDKILSGDPDLIVWNALPAQPLPAPAAATSVVAALDGIIAVAPVVLGNGLAVGAPGREPAGVEIRGVDPALETGITAVPANMVLGSLDDLTPDAGGVVLGVDLAASLGVTVGDSIRLVIPQVRVSPLTPPLVRNRLFTVVGLFDLDFYQWDTTRAYLHIEEARRFLSRGGSGGISALQVKVDRPERIHQAAAAVTAALGDDYFVRTVMDRNADFFKALRTEKVVMFLALGLIILVASLNIVSTLILMVMAKVGEIGALMAMGARARGIVLIFMLQGVIIGIIGTVVGTLLGVGVCQVLDTYKLIRLAPEVYLIPAVPFHTGIGDVVLAVVVALLVSFVATLYPAWRAARLDPVEALHYE